jgi:hypothetical protein
MTLEKIINLSELDGISVDGKRYWTATLYIVKQKPDYQQLIKIIEEGNRFYFIWNNLTFSGTFVWYLD